MRRRVAAAVLALACFAVLVRGQEKKPPADDNRPALTFRDGEAVKPLSIAKADVQVMITGYLAETTLVLTFKNDHSRVLEGELNFPLPQGATVSGYGLDVGGVLVDGVPVEKHQARVAYETELRKGVDPGIVEHVKGNNFRTRVYPIPANGTRTVKVQYVSDLAHGDDGATYVLPLDWGGERIGECNLHVQVQQTPVPPKLRGGPAELAFVREDATTIAKRTYRDIAFTDDLTISLPSAPQRHVVVESRQTGDDKAEHHFVIHDAPARPAAAADAVRLPPARIGILWDASLSRATADKRRELELIERLCDAHPAATFDLVVFRDKPERPISFAGGDFARLKDHLDKLPYDGGTNLAALPVRRNFLDVHQGPWGGRRPEDYAYWLCFTDGLGNLMGERPQHLEATIYVISNDARTSHDSLAHLAAATGGQYLNLKRVSDDKAFAAIGRPAFSLLSIDAPPGAVADVLPAGVTPVNGRIAVSGKLLADEATLTLNYGVGTDVLHRETVTLRKSAATSTGLAPRFWAQQKITELAARSEKNKDALLALGREFNLVTPSTSLMVLETLEQHLTHGIAPAKSRGEMYAAYTKASETRKRAAQKDETKRLDEVIAGWERRVQWHGKAFAVAPDFKYVAPPAGPRPLAVVDAAPDERVRVAAAEGRVLNGETVVRDADAQRNRRPAAPAAAPRPPQAERFDSDNDPIHRFEDRRTAPGDAAAGRELHNALRLEREGVVQELARQQAGGVGGQESRLAGGRVSESAVRGTTAGVPVREDGYRTTTTIDAVGQGVADGTPDGRVKLAGWDPQTPYLKALQRAKPDDRYATYLKERSEHGRSPAFFLDCADFFLTNNDRETGLRVLTNVAELELDSPALLRIVAHRLAQVGQLDLAVDLFEKVLKLRPEEPQSYRDLALALAERNDSADRTRALVLLKDVVTKTWDGRFPDIQTIALMEHNRLAAAMGVTADIHPSLRQTLDADVRIVLTWDADLTDIDLWVTEPTGEKCAYDHPATTIGGIMSQDFTQGYGPEEYLLKKALPGKYKIQANYYGSGQQRLTGPATVQATVITHFGRADEKRQAFTVRLASQKEVVDLGTIEFEGRKK